MGRTAQGLYIRIDGSQEGETLFEEQLDPDFLDLPEGDELVPSSKVTVRGTACRAGEWVVVKGEVETAMELPCAMCNERTVFAVGPFVWKADVPVADVKEGRLDLTEALREAVLLEVPYFVKCGGKVCRNEQTIRQYLAPNETDERHQPFQSLL